MAKDHHQRIQNLEGELDINGEKINQLQTDFYLESLDDFQIVKTDSQDYLLQNTNGEIINRLGAFTKAKIADLQTGLINAQEIITNKLSSQEVFTQKLITPLVETEEIKTNRISLKEIETAPGSDLQIDLGDQESGFGQLIIKGENEAVVASFDAQGNATFSGELTANKSKFGQLLATEVTLSLIHI